MSGINGEKNLALLISTKEGKERSEGDRWRSHGLGQTIQRVGLTPFLRMRWLVEDFAERRNYSELPKDVTPDDVAREIATFVLFHSDPYAFQLEGLPPILPPATLTALAGAMDDCLDTLCRGEPWTLNLRVPVTYSIRREKDGHVLRTWNPQVAPKHGLPAAFMLCVMDLLITDGWRVARCARSEDCNRRFVRTDPRQNYCSARCSQTTRARRLRQPKPNKGKNK
jgi:hypothetical protein